MSWWSCFVRALTRLRPEMSVRPDVSAVRYVQLKAIGLFFVGQIYFCRSHLQNFVRHYSIWWIYWAFLLDISDCGHICPSRTYQAVYRIGTEGYFSLLTIQGKKLNYWNVHALSRCSASRECFTTVYRILNFIWWMYLNKVSSS